MDLIGRARRVNQAMLNRLAPQRFVFHHVPKCGGTSVGRALRMRYLSSQATVKPEASFRALQTFTGRTDTERLMLEVNDLRKQMLLYLMFDDVRCISSHVPFSSAAHAQFRDSYSFITLLREPVSRFLSHYNWSRNRPDSHGHISDEFDVFLTTQRARAMGAEFVEIFADLSAEANLRAPEAIDRAVQHLEGFDLVGRLDDLDGFAHGIRQVLGVRVRFKHENKTSLGASKVTRAGLTDAQLALVRDICAPDIQVWNRIFPS
ncbi:Sulfotransferase family protein [Falsiruegeria litorea R37]|uniref:Sulfotransferase family protein n=1 Tax=Falsiruegeria litorea R37 TaxID=1200284 RepID=A0A1Y5RW46_9RHOB|nr:sulfotransferase family 2 domain-containing protein [Falsiruegeria litorea]SLN26923.1 Sulfotransferase family protein [Falsiruegeria litorea R37]